MFLKVPCASSFAASDLSLRPDIPAERHNRRGGLTSTDACAAHHHGRMRDAGCDVAPGWASGAKLFVPFTPEQVDDPTALGLELEGATMCSRSAPTSRRSKRPSRPGG